MRPANAPPCIQRIGIQGSDVLIHLAKDRLAIAGREENLDVLQIQNPSGRKLEQPGSLVRGTVLVRAIVDATAVAFGLQTLRLRQGLELTESAVASATPLDLQCVELLGFCDAPRYDQSVDVVMPSDELWNLMMRFHREVTVPEVLHSIAGKPNIRCVSPIGNVDPSMRTDEISRTARSQPVRICAVLDPRFRSYMLTAESDVLLGDLSADVERAKWLIFTTAEAADQVEESILKVDVDVSVFRDDLEKEPTVER